MNSAEFRAALLRRADRAGIQVSAEIVDPLFRYFELLSRWNERINLTALPLAKPTDETFDRLLLEPLRAAMEIEPSCASWFDLGSGGGSPALPIKIAKPNLNLTMVESKTRKAAFLRDAVRQLQIESADVLNGRFEALLDREDLQGTVDLVTIRAVRVDAPLTAVSLHLLRSGGELMLLGFSGNTIAGFRAIQPGRYIRP